MTLSTQVRVADIYIERECDQFANEGCIAVAALKKGTFQGWRECYLASVLYIGIELAMDSSR